MKGLSDQGFVGSRVDQDNVGVAFTSDAPLGGHRLWARSYPWGDFLLKMQCEVAKASRRPALPGSVIRVSLSSTELAKGPTRFAPPAMKRSVMQSTRIVNSFQWGDQTNAKTRCRRNDTPQAIGHQ